MSEETEITSSDFKKPTKLLSKFVNQLILGGGGIGQEMVSQIIAQANEGRIEKIWIDLIQTLGFAAGGGAVKNKKLSLLLGGMTAGASKDLIKSVLDKLGIDLANITNKAGDAAAAATDGAASNSSTSTETDEEVDDYV